MTNWSKRLSDMTNTDKIFLTEALTEAHHGFDQGGVPVGAVMVRSGQIVARGRNKRVQENDPVMHGETDCLRSAGLMEDYSNTEMYTTLSPCMMCTGAILHFGIKRVALARALVTEPPVLLLDEPLSALDASLVVRMQGVLSRLQKELGITFIYVTHSQSEAFAMTDRVVIMSKGHIEQIATAQEIFRRPANRFVAKFVGSNNILTGKITKIEHDLLTIDTNIGQVTATVPEKRKFRVAEDAEIVISADLISLSSNSTGAVNEFPCNLISEEFVGSIIGLLVETRNGVEMKIQKQQHEIEQLRLHSDQNLWIRWQPQNAFILPPQTTLKENQA